MQEAEIEVPGDYIFIASKPEDCHGHLYRAHAMAKDIPSYQQKVIVEGITGPDAGDWWSCSLAIFLNKFVPAEENPGG